MNLLAMPSNRSPEAAQAVLVALSVAIILYSLIFVQQVLLGLVLAAIPWLLYYFVRFVRILGRIATSLERIAATRAQEAEPPAGDYKRPSESYERGAESDGGVERE